MQQSAALADRSTQRWLSAAALLVAGFGLLVAAAAHPATAGPTSLIADIIFWPLDGRQSVAAPEARLLSAITGGVMFGWGVMLWLVANRLYPREPALARSIILWGVGAWFVVDSAGSVLSGAPLNVLGNLVFLAMFALPLRRGAMAEAGRAG